MRADHISLKASLKRMKTVPTAACECGEGLQTEEHIFWDCKRYQEQRATMRDILSDISKKDYPKSVTELLKTEERKSSARRLLLHKHSYIHLKIDT
jgi:hypothetical protein